MNDRVPDLLVEQLALGELPPEQARRVRAQLEADDDPRLTELRASDEEILAAHPPEVMARRIQNRLERLEAEATDKRPMWWFVTATLAVAAAAVLVWFAARPHALTPDSTGIDGDQIAIGPDPDTVRFKGDPSIVIYEQQGANKAIVAPNDVVSPGDTLLVSYRADGAPHGVIVSLDGAGEVTLHFPADETASTELDQHGNIALHAFELDDAPGFERFFFVTADAPLDPARVMAAVRELGEGKDPAQMQLQAEKAWEVVDFPLVRAPR